MSNEIITQDGFIRYQTKSMQEFDAAIRFARCLQSNSSRFCDVEVVEVKTRKGLGYRVTFRPTNVERQKDMYERQYNARQERGQAEGAEYVVWADCEEANRWNCFNPRSGETYSVTMFSCTCKDFTYRCSPAAIQCKHQAAVYSQREAGLVGQTDKTVEQRRAWAIANRDLDF
jgi:hypothetical protein